MLCNPLNVPMLNKILLYCAGTEIFITSLYRSREKWKCELLQIWWFLPFQPWHRCLFGSGTVLLGRFPWTFLGMAYIFVIFCAQKPADLEGMCPFTSLDQLCPYGLTCRFLGTHKYIHAASGNLSEKHEINALNKDIQKLLWKNKYKFPKASAQIKLLGLKVYNSQILVAYLSDIPFSRFC